MPDVAGVWSRRPARAVRLRRRLTIRARLTFSYAGMITGSGAVLIAVVYLYMRFVPSYRISPVPARELEGFEAFRDTRPAAAIQVSTVEDFLDNLLMASVAALVLLALVGGTVGWVVAGRIIRPLKVINVAAGRASSGALDHRIRLGGPRDELRDLADTFDGMLASLERSFDAQRRFAANASHELRTPLATTKTMIEVTLADPDADGAELRRLAERVAEVNGSSIETVDALLDLTDADSGTLVREPVDMVELAHEVSLDLADEATEAEVAVTVVGGPDSGPGKIAVGELVLLRQAIANLMRNAIRHNVPGGRAEVRFDASDTKVRVTITNTGRPVPASSVASLAEPFVRGTGRTSTRGSGHGLGLTIVSSVAAAHNGELTLCANGTGGGLTARLELPRARCGPFG